MKITAYGRTFEGSPQEIIESLRDLLLDAAYISDAEAYIRHIQRTYKMAYGKEMALPKTGLDGRIRAMFAILEDAGLMEVTEYV